jgi:hypothetical protein
MQLFLFVNDMANVGTGRAGSCLLVSLLPGCEANRRGQKQGKKTGPEEPALTSSGHLDGGVSMTT